MTNPPVNNSRHYSRVPFHANVSLQVNGVELTVQLIDIALKGALLESMDAQTLALHDPCRLVLALAHGDEAITMTGRIAHLAGSQVGIECLEIDLSSLTMLRRLIELNTGDSERINQELSHLFAGTWAPFQDTQPESALLHP